MYSNDGGKGFELRIFGERSDRFAHEVSQHISVVNYNLAYDIMIDWLILLFLTIWYNNNELNNIIINNNRLKYFELVMLL